MTAPRFQTGGRHQTSLASLPGYCGGGRRRNKSDVNNREGDIIPMLAVTMMTVMITETVTMMSIMMTMFKD